MFGCTNNIKYVTCLNCQSEDRGGTKNPVAVIHLCIVNHNKGRILRFLIMNVL